METHKLFIISFGDSRQYRLEIDCREGKADCSPSARLTALENELNKYLHTEFAQSSFKYYTSPKVTEVEWKDRDKYNSYPRLDNYAIEDIKRTLSREVKNMNSVKKLNNNYKDAL